MGTLELRVRSGFRLLAHTADIGLEACSPSCKELFVAAAEGFKTPIYGGSSAQPASVWRIEVQGADLPTLLVAWLNEILYLCESAVIVPADFRIETLENRHLAATVTGEPFDPARHSVERMAKAVTYHQLVVEERENGWYARVYIDL